MTMLPDIDVGSWVDYQRQKLQQQLQQKTQEWGLQTQMDADAADLQSHVAQAPPEPAPPPPPAEPQELQPYEPPQPQVAANGAPLQLSADEVMGTSAPEPTPSPPRSYPEAAPNPPPSTAPAPAPSAPPATTDWVGEMLGKVHGAGGDVDAFVRNFNAGAGDALGSALGAAHAAGANLDQFTAGLRAPPPDIPAAGPSPGGATPAGTSIGGVPDWLSSLIAQNAPPDLANDPDFIRTVAAGAKAESGWNVDAVQKGGGGRGLFQFDLGGMGAPYASNEQQLLGQSGAQLQASQIVPLYAKAYRSAPGELQGAEKASWVAAQAERPYQYDNPQSAARRNYASAYGDIGGDQNLLQRAGGAVTGAVGGAVQAVKNQISQFGDPQLSNDEAYAACGPAAAVRFAQMYGRNPTLREATDLAGTVGWTSSGGMAGIGSEQQLMQKMGIATKLTNDPAAMAREAQSGNPVTISTPGHYFFADGYDPQSGAFHVGQSGLDLKGGSEWMTLDQMQARMGQVQGALLADNPQVPATSIASTSSPLDALGRAKDAALGAIGGAALGARQSIEDFLSPENQRKLFPSTAPDVTGALDAAVRAIGEQAPTATDLALRTVGVTPELKAFTQGALDEAERRRQDELTQPNYVEQLQANIDAAKRRDWGEFAGGTFGLASRVAGSAPIAAPEADISPIVSAGLGRAGVPGAEETGWKLQTPLGEVPLGPREVLGQLSNLALPTGEGTSLVEGLGRQLLRRGVSAQTVDELVRAATPAELEQLQGVLAPAGRVVNPAQRQAQLAQHLAAGQAVPDADRALFNEAFTSMAAGKEPSEAAAAQIEMRPVTVTAKKNRGETADIPYFVTSTGHAIPLPPLERGIMGTATNQAYVQAVSEAGGQRGFPVGHWTDAVGATHRFDSPQEVVFMHDFDRQKAAGQLDDWWQFKQQPEGAVPDLTYINTQPDKFGYGTYEPDFVTRTPDGRYQVVEAKDPKVITEAEEVGGARAELKGPLGWHVLKKAIGVIPQLADNGVGYRILGNSDAARVVNEVGQGSTQGARLGSLPGIDWRDAPEFARRGLQGSEAPASGTVRERGNRIIQAINDTAQAALGVADQLKSHPEIDADQRRQILTRMVRNRLLPTASIASDVPSGVGAELGRVHGLTRPITAALGTEAPPSLSRGALSMEDLANQWPEAADILGRASGRGVNVGPISMDYVHGPTDTESAPRLFAHLSGDPAGIDATAAELGRLAGGLSDTSVAYIDSMGNNVAQRLNISMPDGATEADLHRISDLARQATGGAVQIIPSVSGDGTTAALHLVSDKATPGQLGAISDRISGILSEFGIQSEAAPGTVRAIIKNYAQEAGGYDTALARARELLGETPIGGAYDAAHGRGSGAGRGAVGAGGAGDLGQAGRRPGLREPAPPGQDLAGVDFSDLGSQVRELSHEEARQIVGGAYDPGSAVVRRPGEDRTPVSDIPWSESSLRLLRGAKPMAGARDIASTAAEEVKRLNLDQYPEDIRSIIEDHADGINWARLQRRGVIPDEVSKAMADRYAQDTTLSQTIEEGRAGRAYNDYQTRAIRNATGAQAATLRDAASKIFNGDDSSSALKNFAVEANRLEQIVNVAEGARAEAGRSLRAWQDPVRLQKMAPADAVAEITKSIGGDRSRLLEAIGEYQKLIDSGAGPIQMSRFWAGVKNPPAGWLDWFKALRYNSMLSGPRTLEVNGISNSLEIPWRLARDAAASTLRGRPGEVGVEMTGAYAGLAKANQAFLDVFFNGITREQAARGELPSALAERVRNPVGKAIARGLEWPSRILQGMDEWGKAIDYSMSMGRVAAVQASKEGLRGDAWATRVSQILANPETTPQLMKQATGMAERMTFKGDMPSWGGKGSAWGLGAGLQAFTQRSGPVGNVILPFLRTSYHITSRGIDRSPLGLIGTGIDVARGAYGRDLGKALSGEVQHAGGAAPLGERLGDNLLGSAIFGGLYWQAQTGNISGAGPDSTQDKALLRSQGWQPYSIRVGDQWVSYANWGPAAIPFAMAAAATETQRFAKPGGETLDLALDGARRTAQIAQEQTYLQAIGTAWKAIQDPAQYGSQFVTDTITSLIPYGATLNTLGQAFDPTARRVDRFNILDAIQSRLPGLRENVPESQDVLGRGLPNVASGAKAFSPLRISAASQEPLLAEMNRIGYAPPAAPKSFSRGPYSYELTPDEQRQIYEDAGKLIADRAAADINTDTYQKLNDTAKAKRLQMIVDAARTQTENQFLRGLSAEDLAQRRAKSQARKEIVPVSGRG